MFQETIFFNHVRQSLFRGSLSQQQVDGMKRYFHLLAGPPPPRYYMAQVAYILASVYHETGKRMHPVREAFGESDQKSYNRLESAWRRGQLKSVSRPYWRKHFGKYWFGRGEIQITHMENYQKFQKLVKLRFKVDLIDDPNYALEPEISTFIAIKGMREGLFTGHSLIEHINRDKIDFVGARRIVNGRDRAKLIAGYAEEFLEAITEAFEKNASDTELPPVKSQVTGKPLTQSTTAWSAVASAAATLITALSSMEWQLALPVILISSAFAAWIIRERYLKSKERGI